MKKINRALISVSNKQGIVPFAQQLHALGIQIISTGGTSQLLKEAQIPVTEVSELTGFPEMMDGRLKTLHPKIHGGILGRRSLDADVAKAHGIDWIDLVVVNLYPFADVIQKPQSSVADAIENIDIGGPTMIRSAAKNIDDVTVVVDPADYSLILQQLTAQDGCIHLTQRSQLAIKAFAHTAEYDALIYSYLRANIAEKPAHFPEQLHLVLNKSIELRYGENPQQLACAYQFAGIPEGIFRAIQHQGKALSYNNLLDANAANACVREFEEPTCVIVKHANPCGVAASSSIFAAFNLAMDSDSAASFGGVIALNRACDAETATAITSSYFELVIAPGYATEALSILAKKPNLRVLTIPKTEHVPTWHYQILEGGLLMQQHDHQIFRPEINQIVTKHTISPVILEQLSFAWRVVKHVKSNGILIAKNFQSIGVGAGQVARIDAVKIAISKADDRLSNAVLASDGFFPFRDSIDSIAHTGIVAIIQPGGSLRDQEVIDACNEHGIAMLFTGQRCFKH